MLMFLHDLLDGLRAETGRAYAWGTEGAAVIWMSKKLGAVDAILRRIGRVCARAGVGILMDGLPGTLALAGFALAGLGIWLIARPEEAGLSRRGLGTAVACGIGFAGFYIFIQKAGAGGAFWLAGCSRFSALVVVSGIVLLGGHIQKMDATRVRLSVAAGMLDVLGTCFFIRATQTGRLDAAVMLTSLYPAITVILARVFLREHFTRWKVAGIAAALLAVPLIATR